MGARVDKAWQDKGLAAYGEDALLGTLEHYGVKVDPDAFRALAEKHYPMAIGAEWMGGWKGTGKFKEFPFVAADELWRRWLKDQLAPNELLLPLLELMGRLEAWRQGKAELEVDAAFAPMDALKGRLPEKGERRERFMSEVVMAMGKMIDPFNHLAERLAEAGKADAAYRFVDLEELLFPVREGSARALVDAVLGKKDEAIAALLKLANEEGKDPYARLTAVDALLSLEQVEQARPATMALLGLAEHGHDHGFAAEVAERARYVVNKLGPSTQRSEVLARVSALAHAHEHCDHGELED